jgi:cytochrome c biogenesis protein ResB
MSIRARFAEFWNPKDVLDSLWRVFASPYATMLLLIGMAALVCLGVFVPQRPAEAVADPMANSLWLASLRERYGSATDWLVGLRLVDVHRSMLLRGLLGLLAFNLLLGLVDLIRPRHLFPASRALGYRTQIYVPPSVGRDSRPSPAGTPGGPLQAVEEVLRSQHYRVYEASDGDWIHADRFVLFVVLVYLGLLLTIGGLALSERTAWWEEGVILRPGQVHPLGHETALDVRAQVSEASYDSATGTRHEGHTELTFFREQQRVGQKVLRDHAPTFHAGLFFYPMSTEPVLLLQAHDSTGRNLALQTPETGATQFTELALRFREEESPRYIVVLGVRPGSQLARQFQQSGNEQYVLVPSRDLSLRLLYSSPGQGEARSTFQVEAFRPGETSPFYTHQFSSADSVEIAGDRYTLQPQRYAVIKFGQDYGLAFIFVGAAMVLTGIVLSAWRHPRRVWVVAQLADGGVNLSFTSVPAEGKAAKWFEDLVQSFATTSVLKVHSAS